MKHNRHGDLKMVFLLTDEWVIHQREVKAFVRLNLKSSFRAKRMTHNKPNPLHHHGSSRTCTYMSCSAPSHKPCHSPTMWACHLSCCRGWELSGSPDVDPRLPSIPMAMGPHPLTSAGPGPGKGLTFPPKWLPKVAISWSAKIECVYVCGYVGMKNFNSSSHLHGIYCRYRRVITIEHLIMLVGSYSYKQPKLVYL